MANNELSGPLTLVFLYERLAALKQRRYTYRFVINPEGIGAIAYLTKRGEHFKKKLLAGYVLTCLGYGEKIHFKQSRRSDTIADSAAEIILKDFEKYGIIPFFPHGSDEQQYCSPGFNLPVGSLFRSQYGTFDEYHTSLDNKNFIRFENIIEAVGVCESIALALENNYSWKTSCMKGTPFLSSRGLYPTVHSLKSDTTWKEAMFWMLNLSDGENDLLSIAKRAKMPVALLYEQAIKLEDAGLLTKFDRRYNER